MANEIAKTNSELEKVAQTKMLELLGKHKRNIEAVLGKVLDPKRFAWLVVNNIRQTPALLQCSPASVLNSVMLATQMGVEIRRDSAYLIPFGKQCTLLLDYKAKLTLARRSNKVTGIQALTIRENDEFDSWTDEKGFHLRHRQTRGKEILSPEQRGEITGVYAYAQLAGGGMQWRAPMSIDEIERIRKRSRAGVAFMSFAEIQAAAKWTSDATKLEWQTWDYSDKRRQPWVTDYEQMALKTVLHSLCKNLPLDPLGQLSQQVDDGADIGDQPDILGDAVDVDPVDMLPMVNAGVEEFEKVKDAKMESVGKKLSDRVPEKATLSAINGYRVKLEDKGSAWGDIMFEMGYETTAQIPTEEKARAIKQRMLEAEQGV